MSKVTRVRTYLNGSNLPGFLPEDMESDPVEWRFAKEAVMHEVWAYVDALAFENGYTEDWLKRSREADAKAWVEIAMWEPDVNNSITVLGRAFWITRVGS